MKNKKILICIVLFFIIYPVFLFSDKISFGGDNIWKNIILKNIKNIYIPYKGYGLTLDKKKIPDSTDLNLYLSFDDIILQDITHNYNINYYNYKSEQTIKIKGKSGAFFYPEQYIIVKVKKNDFLDNCIDLNSFGFDFYMYPVLISNKTVLIKKGVFYDNKFFGFRFYFENKKLIVKFDNFFYDSNNKMYTFVLKSKRLFPKKWYHIQIFFNKSIGKLELIINGIKEDIIYTTVSGKIESEILVPHFSKLDGSNLELFKDFYGYIDEFKISNNNSINYTEFDLGTIESKIIDLKYFHSKIAKLAFMFDKVNEGYIKVFIKKANNKRKLKDSEWISIDNPINKNVLEVKNINDLRFFKWKVELKKGEDSAPILRKVDILYEKNLRPLPPVNFTAKIYAGNILLRWKNKKNSGIKGYIIYWGTVSKNYENKLDIGMKNEYVLSDLKKGVRYYFVITSYNSKEPYNESEYSREISVYYK